MLSLTSMLFGMLSGIFSSTAAHAYLPPSFFMVQTLAKKHAQPGSPATEDVKFRHRITYFRGNEAKKTFIESLSFANEQEAIVKIYDESGKELASNKRRILGSRVHEMARPFSYDFLFIRDNNSIFERFKSIGLPMKTESELYSEKEGSLPYKPESTVNLVRQPDNRVLVALADSPTARFQYWAEKDSLLPYRAVFPATGDGSGSQPLEYRFSQYSVHKSFLYPKITSVYKDGALWAKIELLDFKGPANAERAEADGESREFIEQYLKWVR